MTRKGILSTISTLSIFSSIIACGTGGIGAGDGGDDVQYAALGASDATGIGASPLTDGYVYLIEDGIQQSGLSTNLLNYGVPDIEIGGIRDVELKLLDLGPKPDIITLFAGGNDIISGSTSSHFETDLAAILEHTSKIDGAQVFVADLPDLSMLPRFKKTPDSDVTAARVVEFNAIIRRQASRFNATVIPLSGEPSNDNLIAQDGLHPNDAGYRRIADLFLQEILPRVHAAKMGS